MPSNTYVAGGTGICPEDADLLNRLRLAQERLARMIDPVLEDSAAPKPTVSVPDSTSRRQRITRRSMWWISAGRIRWQSAEGRRSGGHLILSRPAELARRSSIPSR